MNAVGSHGVVGWFRPADAFDGAICRTGRGSLASSLTKGRRRPSTAPLRGRIPRSRRAGCRGSSASRPGDVVASGSSLPIFCRTTSRVPAISQMRHDLREAEHAMAKNGSRCRWQRSSNQALAALPVSRSVRRWDNRMPRKIIATAFSQRTARGARSRRQDPHHQGEVLGRPPNKSASRVNAQTHGGDAPAVLNRCREGNETKRRCRRATPARP